VPHGQVSPEELVDPEPRRTRRLRLRLPAGRAQRAAILLGAAVTAIAVGGIMGSVKLSNGQDQYVLWTKLTPDILPPIA